MMQKLKPRTTALKHTKIRLVDMSSVSLKYPLSQTFTLVFNITFAFGMKKFDVMMSIITSRAHKTFNLETNTDLQYALFPAILEDVAYQGILYFYYLSIWGLPLHVLT